MQHHRPHHGDLPPLHPTAAWTAGLAATLALLLLLAATGGRDEQRAAQAQAEHSAWLQGLEEGELRANEALIEGLAECHRATPLPPMRPTTRQPAGGGAL